MSSALFTAQKCCLCQNDEGPGGHLALSTKLNGLCLDLPPVTGQFCVCSDLLKRSEEKLFTVILGWQQLRNSAGEQVKQLWYTQKAARDRQNGSN